MMSDLSCHQYLAYSHGIRARDFYELGDYYNAKLNQDWAAEHAFAARFIYSLYGSNPLPRVSFTVPECKRLAGE